MKWPLVTRRTLEAETKQARLQTRRSLIRHLRQNRRGLVCLDDVVVHDVTAPGPITFLGDRSIVRNNTFVDGSRPT